MSKKKIKRGKASTNNNKRDDRRGKHTNSDSRARSIAQIRGLVLRYFRNDRSNAPIHYKQLASSIGAEGELAYEMVHESMDQLVRERILANGKQEGTFRYNSPKKMLEGVIKRKSGRGDNLFFPDDGGDPIRVAERNTNNAMDGDRVVLHRLATRRGQDAEGEVIDILERAESNFVGVLSVRKDVCFLLTESRKLANDIFIPQNKMNGGKDGDKVIVRVTAWPERAKNPEGEVLAVIGKPGDNDTEMHAILAEFGLPYQYPEEVEAYANQLSPDMAYDESYQREDFRKVPTLTIDPDDAKDFDDALSYRKISDNKVEVGVHIADVTAYVLPDDIIDKEAAERATSVYLVDRTIPMLPERLCNDLCSLKPDVDRPAYSVIFEMNHEGKVLKHRITRTIIHSDRRLTYDQAQALIDGKDGAMKDEVLGLQRLAEKLRAKRMADGAIAFESEELAFKLDEKGKPLDVYVKQTLESNKLVEEFMLLANRSVASFIHHLRDEKNPPTFVYRVHDRPDEEKLATLKEFVGRLGYRLNITGTPQMLAQSINKLLEDVKGKPEQDLIETLTVRSISKAVYQTDNIGHYGLAFEDYTHFTSPIRRHPDMMVHRLLTHYMNGGKSVNKAELDEICKHDSNMEKLAADADRASVKYKQVEYMQQFLGQFFDGVISGVQDFGIFVELTANGCEGLVPIRDMDDDFYELDERTYSLVGINHKRRYSLGDKVTVKIVRADLERKQLDFELA